MGRESRMIVEGYDIGIRGGPVAYKMHLNDA